MEEESERESESERDRGDRERGRERRRGVPPSNRGSCSLSTPITPGDLCFLAVALILRAVIILPVLWYVSPPHN